jgi:hypothetical protein
MDDKTTIVETTKVGNKSFASNAVMCSFNQNRAQRRALAKQEKAAKRQQSKHKTPATNEEDS